MPLDSGFRTRHHVGIQERPAPTSPAPCTMWASPSHPGSPPAPSTPIVGRTREAAELLELLATSRLLTLTGAGGSGKTRLALEVFARREAQLRESSGGVHGGAGSLLHGVWVDLAPVHDPGHLAQAMAGSLGVVDELPKEGGAVVLPFLPHHPFLLALDNCEHLTDACGEAVQVLLAARPALTVLATSREVLGVPGERTWLVPGLEVPPDEATPEALAHTEAVRLFVARAKDVSRTFTLTPENAPSVADICRTLDGLPLALELAAARVKVLSVAGIRAGLDDALSLLRDGGRQRLPRHRTLEASIEGSVELLPEGARRLLFRLSVFRGGFSLDGACAVGAEPGEGALETLDQVALLVDRSLLRVEEAGGEVRYTLLETIRQFGWRALDRSGELEGARARHAAFVAGEVAARAPHLTRADRKAHMDRLHLDLENIREALNWSREGDPPEHIRMVGDLWWYYFFTRHWKEAAGWIQGALAIPAAAPPGRDRARLLMAAGALATLAARAEEGRGFLAEAERWATAAGDGLLAAMAENYLAMGYAQDVDPRAVEHAARALAWFASHPEESGHRLALLMSALAAEFQGDRDLADQRSAAAVEAARAFGPGELAATFQNWSLIWALRGDMDRAAHLVLASLAELRKEVSYFFLARGVAFMGEVAEMRGDPLEGVRLLGAAHGIRERIGIRPIGADATRLARVEPRLRSAVGDEAYNAVFAQGAALPWEGVVDELLSGWTPDAPGGALPTSPARPMDSPPPAASELPALSADPSGSVPQASPANEASPVRPVRVPPPTGPIDPSGDSASRTPSSEPGGERLRIRTLGGFELEGEHVMGGSWSYARPRELLLFLLLHPKGATRQEIGEAIWPEATPPQVKNSFHVTLHHLRRRLGDAGWIERSGERYRLVRERGVVWDAERFEAGVQGLLRSTCEPEPEAVEAVLALYGGPLLDGEGEGRWIEDRRDHLRRLREEALSLLARLHEGRGATGEALEAWQRVVASDPLNEMAHRGLLRGWARTGARERALRHYDRLCILLDDAFGAEPEEKTRALHRALLAGDPL